MTSRLAFTSCSDPMDEPVQPVWDRIADERPDHLVLLGDQIYMDFGILIFKSENPPLGRPAKMTNSAFAAAMHERYERQWGIMRASRLAQLPHLQIHGIWDDHDFAWNNSFGDSGSNDAHGPGNKRDPVSRDKQRIARRLMRDFFGALRHFTQPYPANPVAGDAITLQEDLAVPMFCAHGGGAASIPLGPQAKLLLTDGRSFRTHPNDDHATVFGEGQWAWLRQEFNGTDVTLLACSTTLDDGGLPLDVYGDYDKLVALAEANHTRLLCLTGDVHKIDWRHHGPRVLEAVASGAARTSFGQAGAFGLADLTDATVTVQLFADGAKTIRRVVDRASWVDQKA